MPRSSFRALDAGKALEHIVLHLASARLRDRRTTIPSRFTEGDPLRIRLLPPWVARAALLKSRGAWWLWCEPRKGARAQGGQVVVDVPTGRYMVDVLDTGAHAWFSRESAAAPPLVVGLPGTGRAVLARIRRVSATADRPRE